MRPGAAHAVVCANLAAVASRFGTGCFWWTPACKPHSSTPFFRYRTSTVSRRPFWGAVNGRLASRRTSAPGWTCYPLVLGHRMWPLVFTQHAWKRCSRKRAAPMALCWWTPRRSAVRRTRSWLDSLRRAFCWSFANTGDRRTEVQESVAKLHGAQVPCLGSVLVREARSRAPFCITNC